ncbi:hypothetical protein M431DRAFT_527725 [Trichoderma harzianum CBS 226.95]|uniref:Uncharacterized protein n=1 Tax=Trichoderma harzianum CBS 226.95 TaxID=983964 RepID=A0A2T4AQ26_TRIHA|nr:hypothetical protein M431DRAFT_527725 [Trichoderma harzianum CBS 226.95]PTB59161.1 hypothetical protein M431DRAFT_527725 [Trichoderma harzianum CBS 226.95]
MHVKMATTSHLQAMTPEQKAITNAKSLFEQLNNGDQLFQSCVSQTTSISQLIKYVDEEQHKHKNKASSRLLEQFQRNTEGLQSLSSIIELAVQVKADCFCPLWAPVKLILQISKSHSHVVHHIIAMVEVLTENMSRMELYQNLQRDPNMQTELLQIFNDVAGFCVESLAFFQRRTSVRVWKLMTSPPKESFQRSIDQLKSHIQGVHNTAVAIELAKQDEYRREQERLRIISSLGAANMREAHQRKLQAKVPNTCEWILSHPIFVQWDTSESKDAADRFLFISGKSGCGKSILASSITEALKRQGKQTMYFYFSGLERSQQDADNLVRWYLLDALRLTSDETVQSNIKSLFSKGDPTSLDLWGAFGTIMAESETSMYLVIDGIDECRDSIGDLFARLHDIISRSIYLKIVLLGRSHVFEEKTSTHWIRVTNELLHADLKAFITTETQKNELLKQPNIQKMIIDGLLEKADGMFLWAQLSINELCRAYSLDDIKRILQRLPSGIENTYDRILHEIIISNGETGLEPTKNILGLLVASGRTLELKELQHAYAIASRMRRPEYERDDLDAYKGPNPEKMFLRACRGLIDIDNGKIRLVHLTAKEYLTRAATLWNSQISILRIELSESHELFGNICVESINNNGFEWFHKREGLFMSKDLDYPPLFSYAFRFITYHFNRMKDPSPETISRIKQFATSHLVSWFEMLIVACFMDGSMAVTMQEFWEAVDWLTDDPFNVIISLGTMKEQFRMIYQAHAGNYWQFQRVRLLGEFFSFVEEDDSNASRSAANHKQKGKIVNRKVQQLTQDNLSQVIQLLADHHTLPLSKQSDLMSQLGQIFRRHGYIKELLSPFDMLFRLFKSKMNSFPTIVLIGFGGLCRPLKRPENALEIFNMVLTRLGDDDEKMKYQVWELIGYTNGDIHDYEAAFHAHQIAWIGRHSLLGPKHRKTANSVHWMGYACYKQKKYAEAEQYLRQTLSLRKELHGLKHEDTATTIYWLGSSRYQQGDYTEAEEHFRQAASVRRKLAGNKDKETAMSVHWIGLSLYRQQKFSEAEGHFRQAASMRAATLGKKDKSTARSLFWLGYSLLSQAKYAEAESHFRRAAAINAAVLGDDRETAVSLTALGEALYLQKRYTKAEEQFRRSQLIIEQKNLGGNDTYILTNPLLLRLSLCSQRKFKDAEDILQSGFKVPPEQSFGISFEATLWLARVLFYQGKHAEAEKILVALFPKSSGNCCGSDRDYTHTAKYSEAESVMRQVILDECNKSRSRRSSVDDGFEVLRMVDEYEDDISDRVDSELSEEDEENDITEEDIAELDAENEAGVNEAEGFGFGEAWEYCHVSGIFAEYLATGQHLEREGKQVEAESVFSLLALLEWNII